MFKCTQRLDLQTTSWIFQAPEWEVHTTSSLRVHWLNCLPVGYVMYFLTYFKGGLHRFFNLSSCNWSSLMFMKDWHIFFPLGLCLIGGLWAFRNWTAVTSSMTSSKILICFFGIKKYIFIIMRTMAFIITW